MTKRWGTTFSLHPIRASNNRLKVSWITTKSKWTLITYIATRDKDRFLQLEDQVSWQARSKQCLSKKVSKSIMVARCQRYKVKLFRPLIWVQLMHTNRDYRPSENKIKEPVQIWALSLRNLMRTSLVQYSKQEENKSLVDWVHKKSQEFPSIMIKRV